METTTVEDRRQVEFEGSKEFPDLCDLGRQPLWNLADYGSCQCPRSRCVGERPEHVELRTQGFVKENPKAGDINYGMIARGMTRAETRLSVMSSPADAIVTVLS